MYICSFDKNILKTLSILGCQPIWNHSH